MTTPSPDNTAVVPTGTPPTSRNLAKVPFVELFNNRVQGIVSSGSDINRVYCAFVAANGDYYSSTNNNRRDAGIPKHLGELMTEAVCEFGTERVARCLQVDDPATASYYSLLRGRMRTERAEPAGTVFSRFLAHLRHLELAGADGPMPEMNWFVIR